MSTCAALGGEEGKEKGGKKGGRDTAWMLFSEQRSTSRQNEERVKDDDDATSQ